SSPSLLSRPKKSLSALPALSTTPSTQASPPGHRHIGLWQGRLVGSARHGPSPGWGGRARFEHSSKRHPRKCGLKRFLAVRGKWVAYFGLPPWKKFSAA